ncbi:tyrosine-type recombinase/integrase [Candidatus Stoquefichus massiliensis]|uniref:tyrosine-type recombinase/integrase n=1 Tax=Candidatus Stoquefichus massiliensis TaxID=1470350 RepID=UPI0004BC4E09|nr:tyrosine-type recombinase/integrase [Candidatus Stoquefichus massiliensis]
MLLDKDVDIRHIQKILGHSSISITQIYTYVSNIKQKEILIAKNPRNDYVKINI